MMDHHIISRSGNPPNQYSAAANQPTHYNPGNPQSVAFVQSQSYAHHAHHRNLMNPVSLPNQYNFPTHPPKVHYPSTINPHDHMRSQAHHQYVVAASNQPPHVPFPTSQQHIHNNSRQHVRPSNFPTNTSSQQMREDDAELDFGDHSPVVPMPSATSQGHSQDEPVSTSNKNEITNTFDKNIIGSFSSSKPDTIMTELQPVRSKPSNSIDGVLTADKCHEGFHCERDAITHMSSGCHEKHAEAEGTLSSCPGPFSCPFCKKFFCSKDIIESHLKANHSLQVVHQCSHCQQTFPDIQTLKEHIPIHLTNERKYQCGYCGKTFKTRKDVYQHERHVHDGVARKKQKYDCASCSRFFRTRRALFAHELLEHGKEGGLHCEHCGKVFAFDDKLKRHVDAVHLKIISHVCGECGKGFSDSYALKSHRETVHEKKKDLQCDHCEHKFNNKRGLVRHVDRVHFDKKKFLCEICEIDFLTYSKLVEHIEQMHGQAKEFKCQQCNLVFPLRDFRNLHTNLRHSSRLRCEYCGKYCPTDIAKSQHIKSNHEKKAEHTSKKKSSKQKRWKLKMKEEKKKASKPVVEKAEIGIQVDPIPLDEEMNNTNVQATNQQEENETNVVKFDQTTVVKFEQPKDVTTADVAV